MQRFGINKRYYIQQDEKYNNEELRKPKSMKVKK